MSNQCLRCGHSWGARSKDPLRCPNCKSTRWNKEVITDKCLRCGSEWVQRGEIAPKYCPICHSSMWNTEKVTYTCPKCGKTRTLRSNSRSDLCPSCDVYKDAHIKTHFEAHKNIKNGISRIYHLWKNDKGYTLNYIDNGMGVASLYDNGKLLGEINIESWFRSSNLVFDLSADFSEEKYQTVLDKAVEKILFSNDLFDSKTSNISVLRGVSPLEAEIHYLSETGMTALAISLRLNVPFNKVMDILSTIPPVIRGSELESNRQENKQTQDGKYSKRLKEKV